MKHLLTNFIVLLGLALSSIGAVRGDHRVENLDRLGSTVPPVVTTTSQQIHEAERLHVVLTGYTVKEGIGPACAQDVVAMKQAFEKAFTTAGQAHRLVVHDLSQFTSVPEVYNYLRKMNIGPRDMVLFYHSGHGGEMLKGKEEQTHELMINDLAMDMNRGTIREILQSRNPFGLVLLTDCCSAYSSYQPQAGVMTRSAAVGKLNWETVRNLFLVRAALVNITAALDGKLASAKHVEIYDTGAESAFTVALLKVLQSEQVYSSWNSMFIDLTEMTRRASGNGHKPRAFSLSEQQTAASVPTPTNDFRQQTR